MASSPFLRLPPELRNQIYFLAFQDGKLDIDRQYRDRTTPAPGMVLACRQTYRESLVMYYASLSLVTKDPWILGTWLQYLNYLPDSHQFKLIKKIYLDCRNRSEQEFPLQLGQRFALCHHTQLSLDRIHGELAKIRGPPLDLKCCVATPSQELVWTDMPFVMGEALEEAWNALTIEQKESMPVDAWLPSGTNGIHWSRG